MALNNKDIILVLPNGSLDPVVQLNEWNITPKVVISGFEGRLPTTLSPAQFVKDTATGRALDVVERLNNASFDYVIAYETVVVIDGEIIGKPNNAHDALLMLRRLNNRWHSVFGGVCMVHSSKMETCHVETGVKFGNMPDQMLKQYVSTGEYRNRAGAYCMKHGGALLVESINGSGSNVIGLPIHEVLKRIWNSEEPAHDESYELDSPQSSILPQNRFVLPQLGPRQLPEREPAQSGVLQQDRIVLPQPKPDRRPLIQRISSEINVRQPPLLVLPEAKALQSVPAKPKVRKPLLTAPPQLNPSQSVRPKPEVRPLSPISEGLPPLSPQSQVSQSVQPKPSVHESHLLAPPQLKPSQSIPAKPNVRPLLLYDVPLQPKPRQLLSPPSDVILPLSPQSDVSAPSSIAAPEPKPHQSISPKPDVRQLLSSQSDVTPPLSPQSEVVQLVQIIAVKSGFLRLQSTVTKNEYQVRLVAFQTGEVITNPDIPPQNHEMSTYYGATGLPAKSDWRRMGYAANYERVDPEMW